jgi:hypothetical protein
MRNTWWTAHGSAPKIDKVFGEGGVLVPEGLLANIAGVIPVRALGCGDREYRHRSSVRDGPDLRAPTVTRSRISASTPQTRGGGRMASVTINVLDPEFYVDPWQAYRWLRDEAPLYWDPVQKLWVISRYVDVFDVEKDTGRYSSSEGSRPLVY